MVEHLYVHIPFCPKICPYCSFYKEASDRNKTIAFLDALLEEAARFDAADVRLKTVFFGGGTPTALSPRQLEHLLDGLHDRFDFASVTECTMEMNPATVSLEKARLLREHGVNRVSMGIQSWNPRLLEILGRVHSVFQAERSYALLREAGFENVNFDHIFGIPTQTLPEWVDTLTRSAALGPEHLSAYCLTYEEDTEFFERHQRGELASDEEREAQMFEQAIVFLEELGYAQYEISNYARPGSECLHNLAYWQGRDYLGLGPSAFSTVGSRRWQNVPDTAAYIRAIERGASPCSLEENLDSGTRLGEQLAFSLRTREGVPRDAFAEEVSARYEQLEWIQPRGDRWILTAKGRLFADTLAEELI